MRGYEEDLYFGDKYGYLYPCTGIFRSYKKEYIQQDDINEESVKETLKYSDDCSYIKPEYKDHYIPVVPETNIHFKNENLKWIYNYILFPKYFFKNIIFYKLYKNIFDNNFLFYNFIFT